ncbi:MAG: DUF349 domain-containing protein [Marinilabiliaceae bacterium]|jgi:hypothetical protein|nr:DUF349 domain-containing protein [Marinilabiliaceae bacterium]
MTIKNPDDSVLNEQLNSGENGKESEENKISTREPAPGPDSDAADKVKAAKDNAGSDTESIPVSDDASVSEEDEEAGKEAADVENTTEDSDASASEEEDEEAEKESSSVKDLKAAEEKEDKLEDLPEVDYSARSRSELVETLEILIENRPPVEIRDDVDKIKILFYKKYKFEVDELKSRFLAEGGSEEDFKPPVDELESIMKRLLSKFRSKKAEHGRQFEMEKQENLRRKYEIIEQIKDLVNREESINKTFQEFRELQNEWYSLGAVPQSSLKNLWETYNHNVEIFYDYIKINKELRDLDFKKNQELKEALCVKAEELIKDPNPISSFRILQDFHLRWREIGPVPREYRNELWERFKEATSAINKRHHEYFEKQKDEQKANLDAKTELCEKVESILQEELKSFKEWEDKAKQVILIQKNWRKIGFAPKKYNTAIYNRFRAACDKFFQEKRNYYAANKETQVRNLELKTALCEKAEEMQDSTNWKATTEEYIKLQKEWKEIGSVPRKYSDKIWKRFRKACDTFFNKKSEFFSEVDSSFDENLEAKEKLIQRLEDFEPGVKLDEAFEELKKIQEEWNSIGYVPFRKKDEISNKYRVALNKQFDKLKIDEDQKAIIKFQNKLENLKENPKASRKLRTERDRFILRIKQLESDIVTWENNIGFFSKSSNADSMIKEVKDKIENARKTIEMLEEKVRMIDQSGLDE